MPLFFERVVNYIDHTAIYLCKGLNFYRSSVRSRFSHLLSVFCDFICLTLALLIQEVLAKHQTVVGQVVHTWTSYFDVIVLMAGLNHRKSSEQTVPVSHNWYFRQIPSFQNTLLRFFEPYELFAFQSTMISFGKSYGFVNHGGTLYPLAKDGFGEICRGYNGRCRDCAGNWVGYNRSRLNYSWSYWGCSSR